VEASERLEARGFVEREWSALHSGSVSRFALRGEGFGAEGAERRGVDPLPVSRKPPGRHLFRIDRRSRP